MNTDKINDEWENYSMRTFDEKTYRRHPHDLSDPAANMTLSEIIKYRKSKELQ